MNFLFRDPDSPMYEDERGYNSDNSVNGPYSPSYIDGQLIPEMRPPPNSPASSYDPSEDDSDSDTIELVFNDADFLNEVSAMAELDHEPTRFDAN